VAKLTGINNKMLRSAPKFHEVAKRILEITDKAIIVAHNAQFDYRILRTEFRRLGYDFQRRTLCTVDLSKQLIPDAESHSLGKLVRSLGIATSDRHRANGDAVATLKLFKLLLAKDKDKRILGQVIREETHGELSPTQLDMVLKLPSETGVYYLYDKDGAIIHLDAARDIKKRVNQHFTQQGSLARKLQKETKRVAYEVTGSELLASLKEYAESLEIRPKYKPGPRKRLFSHVLDFGSAGPELMVPEIKKGGLLVGNSLGFNGHAAAKSFLDRIRQEFELCPDTPRGNLGEGPEICNERLLAAFDRYSIKGKNMVLLDRGREIGERSFALIKGGQLLGFGYVELNFQITRASILESIMIPMVGDGNTRYLIESHLRKSKDPKIVPLGD
jgi:DNA polymerase-3 subunit epsilon